MGKTISDDLLLWRYQSSEGACVLQDFTGLDETFRLHLGTPLGASFPGDVAFHMHPDFPHDLMLTDSLLNSDQCLVVSARLRAALAALEPVKVEFLPVAIIDHKKRKVPDPYFIVHPIEPVDCIDRARSDVKTSRITPTKISAMKRMVLDPARVPAERTIFRLRDYWGVIVVRRAVAEALDKGGFTGVRWLEPKAYPEK